MFESIGLWSDRQKKQLQHEIKTLNKRRSTPLKVPKTREDLIQVLKEDKLNQLFETHVSFHDHRLFFTRLVCV